MAEKTPTILRDQELVHTTFNLALCYMRQKDFSKAIPIYERFSIHIAVIK